MTTSTTLPLNTLRMDPVNVRTIGRGAEDAALKASLLAYGVKLPLIVRQAGDAYAVYVGGRRLEQLQMLAQEGAIAPDYPVPVIVENVDDAQARQVSLAENIIRRAMHPVDEYRAFAAMNADREQALEPEAIASRFGLSLRHVEQRLALGRLHPDILDAWRDGKLGQETAQAFTLCADLKAQARLFRTLAKDGQVSAHGVRRWLKLGRDNPGRLLAVVGQPAYEARGGSVQVDLFGDDHQVSDPDLLREMMQEKLAAEASRLEADGWSFVLVGYPEDFFRFGDVDVKLKASAAEKAELARLEAACEGGDWDARQAARAAWQGLQDEVAMRSYTAKQKAQAGCVVVLDEDEGIVVHHGKVRPAPVKPAKQDVPAKNADKAKAAPALSQALRLRLASQLAQATKEAMLADRHPTALAALTAKIIAGMIDPRRPGSLPYGVAQRMDNLRTAITPKVLAEAVHKRFDAKDYFASAPRPFLLAAMGETLGSDAVRKAQDKSKADLAKICMAQVAKSGWLPEVLRYAGYTAPGKAQTRKAA
jgi:ParB family transcriptional regulator, chromosome partitioning protein